MTYKYAKSSYNLTNFGGQDNFTIRSYIIEPMKITINEAKCARCNMCEAVSGGIIGDNGQGKVVLNPSASLSDPMVVEAIKMTASVCPQQAIEITE